jgi:hypothetical protein
MPLLNRENLEEEFNINEDVQEAIEPEIVDDEEDKFEKEWEEENNPRQIIADNIERANEILDQVQDEMKKGNFSARMVEVAGNLINSITAASKELISDENYKKYLHLREKLVKLKKVEVDWKISGRGNKVTNQNLILANREDLLKLIGKKNELPEPKDKKEDEKN